jgi:hypothetical protein
MINKKDFEMSFAQALSSTPNMPDCYSGILRRITRRKNLTRTAWGIAASLVISLASFVFINDRPGQTIHADVVDELSSIRSHLYGEDIQEEVISCSLVGDEID